MLPGDETLQTRLEPEVYARLEAYTEKTGTPLIMFNKFKPGIVALVLVMEEYKRQGFDPELGIDKHFLDAAKAAGKENRQLETSRTRSTCSCSIDDKLDDLMMAEFLDQMVDVKAMTAEMIGYWQAGDADGLDSFLASRWAKTPRWRPSTASCSTTATSRWPTRSTPGSAATRTSLWSWVPAISPATWASSAARGQGVGGRAGAAGRARGRALIRHRKRSRCSAGGRGQWSSRRRQRKRLRATHP